MIQPVESRFQVPATDGVTCTRFVCGHERILSASDHRKLMPAGEPARCVECERQRGGGE